MWTSIGYMSGLWHFLSFSWFTSCLASLVISSSEVTTVSQNIPSFLGFLCYLLQVWESDWCISVSQSRCNIFRPRLLTVITILTEPKMRSCILFFIGVYMLGQFMVWSVWHYHILHTAIGFRFHFVVASILYWKTKSMENGVMRLMYLHFAVHFSVSRLRWGSEWFK